MYLNQTFILLFALFIEVVYWGSLVHSPPSNAKVSKAVASRLQCCIRCGWSGIWTPNLQYTRQVYISTRAL